MKNLSYRQRQAIEFWMRNRRKNKADSLRKAGYSEAIARQPHKVFNSPAVRRELELRGHGSFGISNNEKPSKEPLEVEKPVYKLDVSSVTEEQINKLRDRMEEVAYLKKCNDKNEAKSSYIPQSDWGVDIFEAPPEGSHSRESSSLSSM